jgi:hypothetical protein
MTERCLENSGRFIWLFLEGDNMSFDEENNEPEKQKPKTFFGLELGDGLVYGVVIILTLIFIRQVSVVIAALN